MPFKPAAFLSLVLLSGQAESADPVSAYSPLYVDGNMSTAFAAGVWDHNIPSDSSNAVQITCEAQTKRCVGAAALVAGGFFSAHLEQWHVISWTSAEVTAVRSDGCTITTLTINFTYKEVLQITRNGGAPASCPQELSLKSPIIKKLISSETLPNPK
jgi:hypothetical protein